MAQIDFTKKQSAWQMHSTHLEIVSDMVTFISFVFCVYAYIMCPVCGKIKHIQHTTELSVAASWLPSTSSKLTKAPPLIGSPCPLCPPTTNSTSSSPLTSAGDSIMNTSSGDICACCRFCRLLPIYI